MLEVAQVVRKSEQKTGTAPTVVQLNRKRKDNGINTQQTRGWSESGVKEKVSKDDPIERVPTVSGTGSQVAKATTQSIIEALNLRPSQGGLEQENQVAPRKTRWSCLT